MTLSDRLCRHIAIASAPASAIAAARNVLLDASGVMYAASGQSSDVQAFINFAIAAGAGPCTILGTSRSAAAPFAALANGAMAHALDYEDAFDAAPGHPNASMIPAAIALAQASGPVSGETFLTALAIGCDLSCRVGLSLKRPMEAGGWYPPPIVGGIAAVAAASRILGLDAKATRDALSLMLCQLTMPGEIMHSPATVIRAVREGFPAQAAVTAALLAREGVAGFETPLEGRAGFFHLFAGGEFDEDVLLEGLGQRWYGEELSYKPWPACRGTHAYIELARTLAEQHRFGWRDVERITVEAEPIHRMLLEPAARKQAPGVAIDAKFSIPFTVGLSLVRGQVTLDDFAPASLSDADVLAVARRVTSTPAGKHDRTPGSGGAMTILLADGREVKADVADALGSPHRPMSDTALMAKFVDCLGRAQKPLAPSEAERLGERILACERSGDVGEIFMAR
jgi:2-methylcitrate dehydratase PrpD